MIVYVIEKEQPVEPKNKSFEVIGHKIEWHDRGGYWDSLTGLWWGYDSGVLLETLKIYISPDLADTAIITTPKR